MECSVVRQTEALNEDFFFGLSAAFFPCIKSFGSHFILFFGYLGLPFFFLVFWAYVLFWTIVLVIQLIWVNGNLNFL